MRSLALDLVNVMNLRLPSDAHFILFDRKTEKAMFIPKISSSTLES